MFIPFVIARIHNARVTGIDLELSCSISIDSDLLQQAGLRELQQVNVCNVTNGQCFTSCLTSEAPGSGIVKVNGATARKVNEGDTVMVTAFGMLDERELNSLSAAVLILDENNCIERVVNKKL